VKYPVRRRLAAQDSLERIAVQIAEHDLEAAYRFVDACWFLAVDFDKADWQADVRAFRRTCERFGLHTAVERSRSGNGAHVWFFFSRPVPAIDARRMGSYLLSETMTRRHELPLTSYDRLFPNQDTMSRGGG
jgi:hypothetical protein